MHQVVELEQSTSISVPFSSEFSAFLSPHCMSKSSAMNAANSVKNRRLSFEATTICQAQWTRSIQWLNLRRVYGCTRRKPSKITSCRRIEPREPVYWRGGLHLCFRRRL